MTHAGAPARTSRTTSSSCGPRRGCAARRACPGDKSISHRALLFALLAPGESRIAAAGDGDDVRSTARLVAALGARVERTAEHDGRVDYLVASPGGDALHEPDDILDCGNSGTSARLAAGVLAGRDLFAVLDGDASLRRRPMGRVVEPLTQMGATIAGRGGATLLPLAITGRASLSPITYDTPVPSAQVKSAILIAGLAADGETWVTEAVATRDHTERMLRARGVAVDEGVAPDGRHTVRIAGPTAVAAVDETVPADPSAAAFWLVAGAIHPDAELRLEGVSTNPTRRAIIDILRRMGADIEEHDRPTVGGADGEPLADLVVRSSDLRAVDLSPAEVAAAIDEIPILALAAALARGTTRFQGGGELRHKESDRIAGIAAGLGALGADVRVEGDDIEIHGGKPPRRGGHRDTRRPPARDDVRDRGPARPGRDDRPPARIGGRLVSGLPARTRGSAGMTKRVVLIGHPVAHSLSGAMQQAAFDNLGIDARYELWDRAPIDLGDAIVELRTDDFLGANVTIPHKERVVPMVDRLTDEAHATGAVNTLTKEGRKLVGHNTDVPGFKVALDALVGRQKMPRTAIVLGAGGGARAVVYGLIREGFQRIIVFNRHLHRAEGLVKHFGRSAAHMELRAMPWHESIIEAELAKTRILVNATSIGLQADESPVPAEILNPELLVLDLIYARTKLLREAAAAGCATADGETMLLNQGAAAFTLWIGQPAPLEVMAAALADARAKGLRSAEGEPAAGAGDEPADAAVGPAVDPAG